jgi:hypothetical protein
MQCEPNSYYSSRQQGKTLFAGRKQITTDSRFFRVGLSQIKTGLDANRRMDVNFQKKHKKA